jgi:GNAT superfamily N-acetyltransferase
MHQNGYVKLPPGKLANAVTWLEIADPAPAGVAPPAGMSLRRLGPADAALFHKLYRDIGSDWLWAGLVAKGEAELAQRLARPDLSNFAAMAGDQPVGLLELEFAEDAAEVVYFGFIPTFVGKGAGRWLMDEAKRIARDKHTRRLWLHTCNFDHPGALAFYGKQGFAVTDVGYEIMDDPRASGLLPADAAPHVPFIPPASSPPRPR